MFRKLLRSVFITLFAPVSAVAIDGWSQLKAGMTRIETTTVLGAELGSSRGRGFEVAIYDNHAEVVYFNGQLVAWTAPVSSQSAAAPTDAWQFDQGQRGRGRQPLRQAAEAIPVNTRPAAILPAYRL